MSFKCFLDMDGVLADFVGGACEAHRRPFPYTTPLAKGIFELETLWGITAEEFYEPTNNKSFWENLAKTPEADSIVTHALALFGEKNVALLSSPSRSDECIPGKKAWIAKHFPIFERRTIFASAKEFLAGPERILVDDRDKNIEDFEAAGGKTILVPRLWNHEYNRAYNTKGFVELRFLSFEGR